MYNGHPNLGASANVVVRLSQTVNTFVNHIIYFDNFYTTVPLLVYLRAKGIHSLGTLRVNRIPNCKLPSDNKIKDRQRGVLIEYVGSVYSVEIINVLWKDNNAVRLLSTYVGVKAFIKENTNNHISKIPRYDRKSKHYIEIDCPQIIREYNCHMGGVDLMDGLMGRYRIRAKTRDAATRLFYHLVDMAATNGYLLYRRIQRSKNPDSLKNNNHTTLQLPEFRESVAAGLVAYKEKQTPGRPYGIVSQSVSKYVTLTNNQQPNSLRIGSKTIHPVADIR
ncbi:uncharacterized protein LOC135950521 [Calliphora vicina]|uniref:uncharacterized protein LOC135950521 n=1 Tax=Calliphora vicina TaxID=7373 RepID=UPI00325BD8A1